MGPVGIQELFLILLIVGILFGASRLPKIGRGLGEAIREFRKVGRELHGDDEEGE